MDKLKKFFNRNLKFANICTKRNNKVDFYTEVKKKQI